MCQQMREIYIPGMHSKMYVKCGHCAACLQEKAISRSNMIRWQLKDKSLVPWFSVLSYDNKYIPYIRESEFHDFCSGKIDKLPIHRDFDRRRVPCVKTVNGLSFRTFDWKDKPLSEPIDYYTKEDFGNGFNFDLYRNYGLPKLRYWLNYTEFRFIADKCSICYWPDFSDFIKRLKSQFINDDIFDACVQNFKWFGCSEYGPDGKRAHFHFLPWTPSSIAQDTVLETISKAWPYASRDRLADRFGRAYNPAAYVASYVNSSSAGEALFRIAKCFRPKHKYSQSFGVPMEYFSSDKIQKLFDRKDLHLNVERTSKGQSTTVAIVLPKHAINRYFPKWKGFVRLTPNEIQIIAKDPDRLATRYYAEKCGFFLKTEDLNKKYNIYRGHYIDNDGFAVFCGHALDKCESKEMFLDDRFSSSRFVWTHRQIDWKAVFSVIRLLKRRQQRWIDEMNFENPTVQDIEIMKYDYAMIYSQIWTMRSDALILDEHRKMSDNRHYVYFYYNVLDHYTDLAYHDLIDEALMFYDFNINAPPETDPNFFPDVIRQTKEMEEYFYLYDKDKRVREFSVERWYNVNLRKYA